MSLFPCVPPLNIPPLWFFAAASALIMLAGWGAVAGSAGWLTHHYEGQQPEHVERPEARHAHRFAVPWEARGAVTGKCACGALAAVFVEEAA